MSTILIFLVLAGTPEPFDSSGIKEEIRVEASKTETPVDEFGPSVIVVTDRDIAQHQWRTVVEVLHFMPGVSLVPTGGAGGLTNLFLRGAKPEDTLVLINGVKMNDASGTGRGYDFGHLSTAGVARIELIFGPQSTLYGSDSSAGVINIITHKGTEPRYSINLESTLDQNDRASFNFGGASGRLNYAGGLEFGNSQDLSASARSGSSDPLENDEYTHLDGHLSFDLALAENQKLNLGLVFVNSEADIDAFDHDDPNFTSDFDQESINLNYQGHPNAGVWAYQLSLSRSKTNRSIENLVDGVAPQDSSLSGFQGINLGGEFRNTFYFQDYLLMVTGLTWDLEEAEGNTLGESAFGPYSSTFKDEADIFGGFAQARFFLESGFSATFGARYDDHSQFGSKTTWQGNLSYHIQATGTRLRGFYGTGYRAPSIYQQFGPYGNPILSEEESKTWETGLTQDFLNGALQTGLTWYEGRYDNLIDFGFDAASGFFGYLNVEGKIKTSGIETFIAYTTSRVNLRLSYEDADADQIDPQGSESVSTPMLRRFNQKSSLLANGSLLERLNWNLDLLHYGSVKDYDFTAGGALTLDSYFLVNLGLAWQWNDHFNFSARAQNLLDEEYTAISGYSTYGRRVFLGLQYNF